MGLYDETVWNEDELSPGWDYLSPVRKRRTAEQEGEKERM